MANLAAITKRLQTALKREASNVIAIGELLMEAQKELEGHANALYAVAFSPDGSRVLTGSGDNTARLWGAARRDSRHAQPGAGWSCPLLTSVSIDKTFNATAASDVESRSARRKTVIRSSDAGPTW